MPDFCPETTAAHPVTCTPRRLRLGAFGTLTLLLLMGPGSEGLAWFRSAAAPIATYEIKLRKDMVGDKGLIIKEESASKTTVVKDPDGKVILDTNEKTVESYKYSVEILERDGKKPPTRLRRTYDKAQISKDGTTTTLAYEGKTILIEKKGPRFSFSFEPGRNLTAEEATELSKEFDKPEDRIDPDTVFLPSKAVAAGETWKIDMENCLKYLGAEKSGFDLAKSSGSGKLVKAYRKDGKTFGVMEVKMDLAMAALGEGAQKIVLKEGAKMSVALDLDVCIDGTANAGTMKGTITLKGSGAIKGPDGKEFTVDLDVTSRMTERQDQQTR